MFYPIDWLFVPFSLAWTGIAIALEVLTLWDEPSWGYAAWGAMFVLAGLYILVGRLFHDALIRRNMYYAVTNKRALFLDGAAIDQVVLDLSPVIAVRMFRDGRRGTVSFGPPNPFNHIGGRGLRGWTPARDGGLRFVGIDDAQSVADLIKSVQRGA